MMRIHKSIKREPNEFPIAHFLLICYTLKTSKDIYRMLKYTHKSIRKDTFLEIYMIYWYNPT